MKNTKYLKWDENVDKAKNLLGNVEYHQMDIAELALEVCEITWGGCPKAFDEKLTVKRFANSISVSHKSLSNWIAIKRGVFDRLTVKNRQSVSYTVMGKAARLVHADYSRDKVNKIVEEISDRSEIDFRILNYLSDVKALLYNFDQNSAAFKCKSSVVEEVLFYTTRLVSVIKKDKPKIKPRNNQLIAVGKKGAHAISPNIAMGNFRSITIRTKDQKIINYMKRNQKWATQAELSQKIFVTGTKTSKRLTTSRTLAKLMSAGYVYRNDKNQYKLNNRACKL